MDRIGVIYAHTITTIRADYNRVKDRIDYTNYIDA